VASSGQAKPGFYVSARALSSVHAERKGRVFFNVSWVLGDSCQVVVGLLAGACPGVSETCENSGRSGLGSKAGSLGLPLRFQSESSSNAPRRAEGDELLGVMANSVGLDCAKGLIRYNSDMGSGESSATNELAPGCSMSVIVEKKDEGLLEVFFTAEIDGVPAVLGSCPLGPFGFNELFAAVQFQSEESMVKASSSFTGLSRRVSRGTTNFVQPGKSRAKVALSFNVMAASTNESINQLFHVMFNMVVNEYREMHEHGMIGNDSYAWLKEAVAEAVDCTDRELHHTRARDFDRFKGMLATSGRLNARRMSDELRRTAAKNSFVMMFEPALVEYLCIEAHLASNSFWDRLPSLGILRQFGYGRTLSKVELLWAFVEVHEKVIHECPALKQYPRLLECMSAIVNEAKRDLSVLRELAPRRFFYGKHFLALRMLLTRKLAKLKTFTKEGWLADDDAEGLKMSLWDRIQEVGQFVPRIRPSSKNKGGLLRRGVSSCDMGAWSTVTPVTVQAPDSPGGGSAGKFPAGEGFPTTPRERLDALLKISTIHEELASESPLSETAWRHNFERLVSSTDEVLVFHKPRSSSPIGSVTKVNVRPRREPSEASCSETDSSVSSDDLDLAHASEVPAEEPAPIPMVNNLTPRSSFCEQDSAADSRSVQSVPQPDPRRTSRADSPQPSQPGSRRASKAESPSPILPAPSASPRKTSSSSLPHHFSSSPLPKTGRRGDRNDPNGSNGSFTAAHQRAVPEGEEPEPLGPPLLGSASLLGSGLRRESRCSTSPAGISRFSHPSEAELRALPERAASPAFKAPGKRPTTLDIPS
jgi:hypothetical protein